MRSKFTTYQEFLEKSKLQKIFDISLESEEPIIQDLVTQLLVMTKLLHPEECNRRIGITLAKYGIDGSDTHGN